jgi:hypothetical protein
MGSPAAAPGVDVRASKTLTGGVCGGNIGERIKAASWKPKTLCVRGARF